MTADHILEHAIRDSSKLYVGKKITSDYNFYSLQAEKGIIFSLKKKNLSLRIQILKNIFINLPGRIIKMNGCIQFYHLR